MENTAIDKDVTSTAEPGESNNESAAQQTLPEQKKDNNIRMVTFALGGKDYAIDILKVKEIAKAIKFTYVPNAPHYVRGVYNLRGIIISIIDLRKFFNLQVAEKKEGEAENILILRVQDTILGVIVDNINKVAMINADSITPPPPLFKEANLKYMRGVMEYNNNLHIILDIDKMFGDKERELNTATAVKKLDQTDAAAGDTKSAAATAATAAATVLLNGNEEQNANVDFIIETLATFKNFNLSPINKDWLYKRCNEWHGIRESQKLTYQLSGEEDADAFLETFYSPYTNQFWGEDYVEEFKKILPGEAPNSLKLWNPGCGKGYETYSLACLLREKYPKTQIKSWAIDNSLVNISAASGLIIKEAEVPRRYAKQDFVKKVQAGYQFTNNITDLIIFEYHDLLHKNTYPELDIIVARDILSFFKPQEQLQLLEEFRENLKEEGMLVIGSNERLDDTNWLLIAEGNILAYRKKKN